jgi:transcriptional regulator with XRE-family HTH domain
MSDAQVRRRPAWGRLGTELRRLRRQAGLNQEAIAAAIGLSKATVERYELGGAHGGSPPSFMTVMTWADACEVAHPDRAALRALAEAALDEHRPYRDWGSLASLQEGVKADEATARVLRNFDPWGVPGLLQTAEYAEAILAMTDPRRADEVAEAVAVRMARQAILYQPGRRFEFLTTEEGLRRAPASVDVQRAQLAHLAAVVGHPSITFRVIPAGAPMTASLGTGFVLYEDRASGDSDAAAPFVAIELPHERVEVNLATEVEFYRARYETLSAGALEGGQAAALVQAMAGELR